MSTYVRASSCLTVSTLAPRDASIIFTFALALCDKRSSAVAAKSEMAVPSTTTSKEQQDKRAVAVNDVETPMPPNERIVTDAEGDPLEEIPSKNKTNWLIYLGLFLSLVCYTLVQILVVKWNFANLFVGIVVVTVYLCLGCCYFSKRTHLHRHLLTSTILSAVYSGIVAGTLFVLRIRI